jgi:hypothetical protein
MNSGDRFRNSAAHEAGHGVAAKVLGGTGIVLRINPGSCVHEESDRSATFRNRLAILVAAHVAELVAADQDPLSGDRVRRVAGMLERERQPRPNALAWALGELERECGSPSMARQAFNALAEEILLRAWVIVSKHWNEIEQVAKQLDQRGEMKI